MRVFSVSQFVVANGCINREEYSDSISRYKDALFVDCSGVDGRFILKWDGQYFYAVSRQHVKY